MDFSGRIISVLAPRSGTAKSTGNPWMSQEYVIEETAGQYPKRMCFNVFGEDKIKQMGIAVGQELTVSFDINAREYQGKWYNDIRAWKVEPMKPANAVGAATDATATNASAAVATPMPSQAEIFGQEDNSDLPF